MIKELLENKRENHKPSGKMRISNVGQCWRKIYLELKGEYKQEFSENLLRLFSVGNGIHSQIVCELMEKGNAKDMHVTASEVNIPTNEYFSGRIDVILSDGTKNYICDIKSAGDFTMRQIAEGECPENYKNQVLLYMFFTGIHNGILLFVGKNKSDIEEVEVEYDEQKVKKLVKEVEDFFETYVNKNIEPPRCGNSGPFNCDCCWPKNAK